MSFWKYAGTLQWRQIARTVGRRVIVDKVMNRSAEMAFWFLLGFFPMLVAVAGVASMVIGGGGSQVMLTDYLGQALPPSASGLVAGILEQTTGGGRAWLSLLFALWSSSSAITGVMTTLNMIYGIKEDRPWWKARLLALTLAFATGTLLVSTLVLVMYGPELLAAVLPGTVSLWAWRIVQWPAAAMLLMATLFCLYRFAPNIKKHEWKLLLPGSMLSAAIWIVASGLFKLYVRHFSNFGLLYGSLGTLIILMFWFYLGGVAILVGGEVNAALQDVKGDTMTLDAEHR